MKRLPTVVDICRSIAAADDSPQCANAICSSSKAPGAACAGLRRLALRFAQGALRCSRSWPVAELTSLAALATFKQAATSQCTKRASTRAASKPVLLGGANSPCPGRARRLAGEGVSSRCRPTPTARWPEGGAALGRLCAAEKHRASGRVRTRTLRDLTRSTGSTTASAASGGRCAAGPEDRASLGTLAQRGQAVGAPAPCRPRACAQAPIR